MIDKLKGSLQHSDNNDSYINDLADIYYMIIKEFKKNGVASDSNKMLKRFKYEFENLRIETSCYDEAPSKTTVNKMTRFMKDDDNKNVRNVLSTLLDKINTISADNKSKLVQALLYLNNYNNLTMDESTIKQINEHITTIKSMLGEDALINLGSIGLPVKKILKKVSGGINEIQQTQSKNKI